MDNKLSKKAINLKVNNKLSREAICMFLVSWDQLYNPIALRKAKIVYNFGFSESSRVKEKVFSHLYIYKIGSQLI